MKKKIDIIEIEGKPNCKKSKLAEVLLKRVELSKKFESLIQSGMDAELAHELCYKRNTMEFKLSEDEVKRLREWQDKINDLFGEYGHYSYTFTPNGIATEITVRSHLTNTELDLTDVDKW